MLRRLLIRDFVIVDALELDFPSGFGALTGETGAGKSILVDALALALGDRADAAVVRNGCARAEVAAEFEVGPDSPAARWLAANDLAADGCACLLRRMVEAGGRSRGYINGSPATAAQMRELGELLADIHGQHAHHALLRAETQRALLDAHGGLTDLVREVGQHHRAWRQLADARRGAEHNAAALAREREMLDWQLKELRELGFDPQQWLETNQEHRRLANAALLLEAAAEALADLEEGEIALTPRLEHAAARLAALSDYDEQLKEAGALLDAARIQMVEAAHLLRRYRERLDIDPQRLAEVESRIQAVHQLARKHRVSAEDLPLIRAELERRGDELGSLSDPAALAEQERQAHDAYVQAAARLSEGRDQAAARLSQQVTAAMQELAMNGGQFEAALEPLAEGAGYGMEAVEFRVAANPQQPLRALAKVASGGELSRIGLSIQVITSVGGGTATLIFDEVDVGIGGRVAEIVGHMLKELGAARQVLCVTHLPQVAAQAAWQWSIAKQNVGAEVLCRVAPLDADGRVEEIARMLGGVRVTATTRKHAQEMLSAAASR